MPHTGDLACNPGMCPDQETNQPPFASQASTQPTEPHQPGQDLNLRSNYKTPKRKYREKLHDIGFDSDFLDVTPKPKAKIKWTHGTSSS